jgi:hypothetical protein
MRLVVGLLLAVLATAQTVEEDFHVYTEHPRLLLTAQRLKLLKRERERQAQRWIQFETLVAGKAAFTEPAIAYSLFHQITGDAAAARNAAAAAVATKDARSLAIAYDWLPAQREEIAPRLKAAAGNLPSTIEGNRTRALVAIVLEDHVTLERLVKEWWRKQIAPALLSGQRVISHAEIYPLMELLHAIRDNLNIDLREDARGYFRDLPAERLLSYYPPTYPAPENDFHIPFGPAPDLRIAAMTRAAELSLVAYDSNSTETQFVQGWLMHDRFIMKGVFGAPYELLWANPYQPGLSYEHTPNRFHDVRAGRLFVRSSWGEDALWVGYTAGKAEVLRDGKPQPFQVNKAIDVGGTVIAPAKSPMRLQVKADSPEHWFVLGWPAKATVDIEAEDEELDEKIADRGGILALEFKRKQDMSVRLKVHEAPNNK